MRAFRLVALLLLGGVMIAGCVSLPFTKPPNDTGNHYREGRVESFTRANGLPSDEVTALAVDGDSIWIGTPKGLAVYNRAAGTWTVYTRQNSKLPDNDITALARDTRGRIWVGTAKHGAVRIGRLNWDIYNTDNELPSNVVRCILAEPTGTGLDDDNVWIGTMRGLARYNADGWFIYEAPAAFATLQRDGLLHDDVSCLAVDDAFLWVGCEKGVARFNDVNWKKWIPEGGFDLETMEFMGPDKYPIKEDEISAMSWDRTGNIYIAARRSQLAVTADGNSWRRIELSSGGDLMALLANPDGELWLGAGNTMETFAALRRFDPESEKWQLMTTAEGLPSNRVNCLVADGRDVWIGTMKGVGHLIRPAAPVATTPAPAPAPHD